MGFGRVSKGMSSRDVEALKGCADFSEIGCLYPLSPKLPSSRSLLLSGD